ncbi:MAG: glycerophosphodiester phosphodiesterase [Micromonosporaceae bacterium]
MRVGKLLRRFPPTYMAALAALIVLPLPALVSHTEAAPAETLTLARAEGPIVFGHRGATGYRPEHTIASYELAIQLGAEYIEPDLVPTRDGALVARHENEIGGTTDVADHPEFADRKTTKTIDGRAVTGWFTEDFTLAELKTLRAVERIPAQRQRNTLYDGRYQVLTLQEVIDFAKRASLKYSRPVGIFPETKHPTYFDSIGLSLEEPLIAAIKRAGLNSPDGRVVVQSFEPTSLRELNDALHVPVLQAIAAGNGAPYDTIANGEGPTYNEMVTPEGLREIATYADWIGPDKVRVIPRVDGALGEPTTLVRDAHAAGLSISAYTFRNENRYLPDDMRRGTDLNGYGDAFAEYLAFYGAGLDAVVSDSPDTALIAREQFRSSS